MPWYLFLVIYHQDIKLGSRYIFLTESSCIWVVNFMTSGFIFWLHLNVQCFYQIMVLDINMSLHYHNTCFFPWLILQCIFDDIKVIILYNPNKSLTSHMDLLHHHRHFLSISWTFLIFCPSMSILLLFHSGWLQTYQVDLFYFVLLSGP